jgi:hypothetical protein
MANYEARLDRIADALGGSKEAIIVVEVVEGEDPAPKIAEEKRLRGIDRDDRCLCVVITED